MMICKKYVCQKVSLVDKLNNFLFPAVQEQEPTFDKISNKRFIIMVSVTVTAMVLATIADRIL